MALVPGTNEEIFVVSTHEPEMKPGRKLSALFIYHGGEEHKAVTDGADKSYRDAMTELLKKAGLADEFVVIAPHSPGRGWRWDAHKIDVQLKLRQLTAWAFQRYSIDPRRVYYSGRSNGGSSSGSIMLGQPKLFAALFPWTGGPEGGFAGIDPKTGPDWYLVASGGETPYWANEVISHLHKMEARGFHVFYREPQGFTHGSVHQRADIYEDGFRWFRALRNKAVPPPPEDHAWLQELENRRPFQVQREEWSEIERIGGTEAGRAVGLALKSSNAALRLAAADSCTRLIYGAEVWNALAALSRDEDAAVRLKVIEAFGVHARWRYFDALEQLSVLALDKKRPKPERIAAIEALNFAVFLDAKGGLALDYPQRALNLRETRALWTWIDLLADDSLDVRTAGVKALQHYDPDAKIDYAPQATAEARAAGTSAWQTWAASALGEKYRPSQPVAAPDLKDYTVTVWSDPPNARVLVNSQVRGYAPATIVVKGTPDRRFAEPVEFAVDAISTDPAQASRFTVRWFGTGDKIPEEISSAAGSFRVLFGGMR